MKQTGGNCVVVYPDEAPRHGLLTALESAGLRATGFANATDALAALADQPPPRLLVTGLAMPGLDGWRFCRLLRSPAYPALNPVPVLAVTATFRGHEAKRLAFAAGANGFLWLPLSDDRFLAAVEQVLAGEAAVTATALVAGTDAAWRDGIGTRLEPEGYAVTYAADGAAALASLSQLSPDLAVVCDDLPGATVDAMLAARARGCVMLLAAQHPAAAPALAWFEQGAAGLVDRAAAPDVVLETCREARAEASLVLLDEVLSDRSQALAESERAYRTLAEDGPTYVSELLPDGTVAYVNRGLAALYGEPPEAIVGRTMVELCGTDWGAAIMARLAALTPDSPSETHEEPFDHPESGRYWLQWTNRAVFDEQGQVLRYQAVAADITSLKRAESDLRRSEERYHSFVTHSHEAIYCTEFDLPIDTSLPPDEQIDLIYQRAYMGECNAAMARMYGIPSPAEFVGRRLLEFHGGVDHPEHREAWRRFIASGYRTVNNRTTETLPDGTIRHFLSNDIGVVEDGLLVRIWGTTIDDTARREAQEALRESEERFRCIADYTYDWESWFGPDGKLLWVSPSVERIVGYRPADCHAMTEFPVPLMVEPDRDRMRALLARAAAGERGADEEFRVERQDGERIVVEVSHQPVRDEQGRSLGYRCCIHDITTRRRTEEVVRTRLALSETFNELGLDELIQAALDAVEALTNSTIGFFHFVDADQQQLTLQAWSPNTVERMCSAAGKGQHYPIEEAGVWVEAFRQRRPVIHNDYASLPQRKGLPAGHASVTRELVVPIVRDGLVRALMGVGNKPTPYTAEDVELARQLEGLVIDLVDRKKAEESLRDSLQRNKALLDANPDFMFVLTAEGRFVDARAQREQEFWRPPDEFLGELAGDVLPPDLAAMAIESMAEARRTGQLVLRTFDLTIGDKLHSYEGRLVPCEDGTFLAVIRDITGQRQAEAERERLMVAIEQADETIVITDAAGTIVYVNAMFETVTGYTRDEAIGQRPALLKSGKQSDAFYRDLWATLTRGEVWRGRFVNRRKDGTLFTEEASITPVRDANNRIVSYVAAKRDITAQLELEAQLLQAQKMESIGRLAGGVAHDFNNLLTPILGYADLLLNDLQPEDPRHADLREIVDAATRAKDLTRQLLAFGRKQVLELGPVDLSAVVANFQKLLRRTLRENIHLELALQQPVSTVLADVGQIEQVLMNLAVNAQDAMPDGGDLRITVQEALVATAPDGDPQTWVQVGVTDTGTGIAPEVRDRLFEPFVTTKESGKGTGLGLATVQGIIAQHGGVIEVESELGSGASFIFRLPSLDQPAPPPSRPAGPVLSVMGSETIMVVDDDPGVRRMAGRILTEAGYRVLLAENAEMCFGLFAAHDDEIDLLLTDVVMPGMNGRQLYEQLAARRPGLPVLYMSGYDDEQLSHSVPLDEASRPMAKPFTPHSLCHRVRQMLDRPGE